MILPTGPEECPKYKTAKFSTLHLERKKFKSSIGSDSIEYMIIEHWITSLGYIKWLEGDIEHWVTTYDILNGEGVI